MYYDKEIIKGLTTLIRLLIITSAYHYNELHISTILKYSIIKMF